MTDETNITPYQRIKLTVEAQIPLVRAMERELGTEAAHALVRRALDENNLRLSKERKLDRPMAISALEAEFASFGIGVDFEFDVLKRNNEELHIDVTKCGYVQLAEKLTARDLGPLLICNCDFALAKGIGLELKREKTCMKGDGHCDFRFRRVHEPPE